MKTVPVPDCRWIETNLSVANIKDQIAALLYASGLVHDDEEVVDLDLSDFGIGYIDSDVIPVRITVKKHQEVEVFNY